MNRKEFIQKIGVGLLTVTGLGLLKAPTTVQAAVTDNKVTVDSALSTTSRRPIQNQAVTNELVNQTIIKNDVTVEADSFVQYTDVSPLPADEQSICTDYPYRCEIEVQNATEKHFPTIVLAPSDASSGKFASVCKSMTNTVIMYAKEKPASTVTIKTIACISAIDASSAM